MSLHRIASRLSNHAIREPLPCVRLVTSVRYRSDHEHLAPARYIVTAIDNADARNFVLRHHYLRTQPSGTRPTIDSRVVDLH